MKVIVTGVTGFIGSQVLKTCAANPEITSVIALSRRELTPSMLEEKGISEEQRAKVTSLVHDDFGTYPEELLKQLEGAEGCIWCIGGMAGKFPDVETARKVGVDFTVAAANAFAKSLGPGLESQGKKFRFVFCSGALAERDQSKRLYVLNDTAKIKGAVENGLLSVAAEYPSQFETYVVRPNLVYDPAHGLRGLLGTLFPFTKIQVQDLAAAMIQLVLKGNKEKNTFENSDLVKMSKADSD